MDEQDQEAERTEEPAQVVVEEGSQVIERVKLFARRHPKLSVLGAAGIALFGGVEIAAAVLIGAGVAALAHAGEAREPGPGVRERARSIVDRAPHAVRERARAVVDAVRGKSAPSETEERAPDVRQTP